MDVAHIGEVDLDEESDSGSDSSSDSDTGSDSDSDADAPPQFLELSLQRMFGVDFVRAMPILSLALGGGPDGNLEIQK